MIHLDMKTQTPLQDNNSILPERLAEMFNTTKSMILQLVSWKFIKIDLDREDNEPLYLICPQVWEANNLRHIIDLQEELYKYV